MNKMRKLLSLILAGCMMMALPVTASAADKTQLNVATELMGATLETTDLSNSWFVMRWGITECLVKNGDDGSWQPWLAESWEVADDNLTWTFKIRDGVTFSNGEPVTASKVKESIDYLYEVQNPDNGGVGDIYGFMTYTELTADDEAGTITIVTDKPTADVPGVMAYPMTGIIDVAASKERDIPLEGPIGTGPYAVTSFTQDHDIQLAKNENYWDGEVPFETVNVVRIPEAATRSLSLQDGSADIAINVQAVDRAQLEAAGTFNISVVSGARDGYYHVNFARALGNETLRKAVFMAIDGEAICDVTTNGSYTYGWTPLAPVYENYGGGECEDLYHYDPDAAMAMLDEAGIVDGDGDGIRELDGENINLVFVTTQSRQMDLIAQAMTEQIKAIGVGCETQVVESQGDYMDNGTFDFVNSNEMVIPTGDPVNFLSHWYSKAGTTYNYSRYENAEYDEIFEKLQTEFDTETRNGYIAQLNKILADDAAMLLGGYYNFNMCSAPTVTGAVNPTCDFYWITTDIVPAE